MNYHDQLPGPDSVHRTATVANDMNFVIGDVKQSMRNKYLSTGVPDTGYCTELLRSDVTVNVLR